MRLKSMIEANAPTVALTFDALVRIRDGRLYRAEFKTFDAFCQSVGMNTRKAYRMLEDKAKKPKRLAAKVAEQVAAMDVMEEVFLKPVLPTEVVLEHSPGAYVSPSNPAALSATEKINEMMQKLSIKPVIDVLNEQYRTHTPIPAMDRLEDGGSFPATGPVSQSWTGYKEYITGEILQSKQIASTELKAWAEKRRAMSDATSEDDAAWACYIAQQIML